MTAEEEAVWRFESHPELSSLQELITIILGGKTAGIAREVVKEYGTELRNGDTDTSLMGSAEFHDLMCIKGMTKSRALKLCAAIELGNRLASQSSRRYVNLGSPENVYLYFGPKLRWKEQEHFVVAYVNVKNRMLGYKEITKGNLNAAPVDIKEVLRWGIRFKAYGLILIHNHPSGYCEPSKEDTDITKAFASAARLLDMEVLDHVIIGSGSYVSLHERGTL